MTPPFKSREEMRASIAKIPYGEQHFPHQTFLLSHIISSYCVDSMEEVYNHRGRRGACRRRRSGSQTCVP